MEPVKSNDLSPRRRKSERIISRGKEPVEGSVLRQRLPSSEKRASLHGRRKRSGRSGFSRTSFFPRCRRGMYFARFKYSTP